MDPNQRYQRAMKVLAASAKVGSTNLRRTAVRFGRSRSIMRVEAFLDIHRIKECLDQNCWTVYFSCIQDKCAAQCSFLICFFLVPRGPVQRSASTGEKLEENLGVAA